MHKYLLFDLDGTLTDSKEGITNSIVHSLTQMNITVPDNNALVHFIGPPLKESFRTDYHLEGEQNEQAIAFYREYFSTRGLFENEVYSDIPELLSDLKNAGYKLYVATSKPVTFARQILDHFELTDYFEMIAGSELDGSRSHKADVIQYVIEENHLSPADCLMIGDRKHDLIGADMNGMDALGVLFGYGSREELASYPHIALISTVHSLRQFLLTA
ncbi:HAD family hydrolase [Macrococcus hajekii]|uniref:HAD family hydrolase n=1 Tax=Macrococcus hajekii TaxID=198482 RepID=A0A4R6BIB0_9STAP|nr:HAD family hydrolase [Macrococcus hajekii]TDM01355.1 HAD family hydrolase [Macrococcus hajekii]GGB10939.1 phosphoglycolate phosphatase [Macrococcus hajekii]